MNSIRSRDEISENSWMLVPWVRNDNKFYTIEKDFLHIITIISIYHTGESYFSCVLIGWIRGDWQVPFTFEQPKRQIMCKQFNFRPFFGILTELNHFLLFLCGIYQNNNSATCR